MYFLVLYTIVRTNYAKNNKKIKKSRLFEQQNKKVCYDEDIILRGIVGVLWCLEAIRGFWKKGFQLNEGCQGF